MKNKPQTITIETDSLLTLTQAALLLNRPRVAVWRMAKRGELHPFRFGGRVLFFMRQEVEGLKNKPSRP